MLTSQPGYPVEIEEDASKVGYKAANLMYVNTFLSKIQEELKSRTSVEIIIPKFIILFDETIKNHLDLHTPNWRRLFNDFEVAFNLQDNKTTLHDDTLKKLSKLHKCLIKAFKNYPFLSSDLTTFLNQFTPDSLFMVRSTGVNEDKVEMANPGGNVSMPSERVDIESIFGEIIAPYSGEKSLLQRLKARDMNITDLPVMPILVQVLVGGNVISGVTYTNNGSMRIQSSHGHGEYVVNSKGPTDNYYISKEGVTYKEIRPKPYRLIPKHNREKKND